MNFSNLALANRVYSGQASISNTDYPTSVKPRTLVARLTKRQATTNREKKHIDNRDESNYYRQFRNGWKVGFD